MIESEGKLAETTWLRVETRYSIVLVDASLISGFTVA